jgi:ribosome-associated protein
MAANTRCDNVVLLDLRGRSPITEYFVIATGSSPRQMRTVVDELQDLGKRIGYSPWMTSGYESAKWIVLDCVNVVVHVFDVDSRDFYDLELLWGDSPRIDWRKELGLPPVAEEPRAARRFAGAAGMDEMEAEEEDARLEGRSDDEEGDADVDEEAELDAPVVTELPDLSTGSNSVEFVEIDPPSKRRQRGRAVYPTPLEQEEDAGGGRGVTPLRDVQSLDQDDQERVAEAAADDDAEAVSGEDLPEKKLKRRAMGGVSASLSSTSIEETGEEDQLSTRGDDDREQDHRDEIPPAHEAAAEAVRIGDVELTTEQPGGKNRRKVLRTRADEKGPEQSAPGRVNLSKARAGVVRPARGGKKQAVKKAAARKPAKKVAAKKLAARKSAPQAPARKAAPKKPVRKPVAKAPPRKVPARKSPKGRSGKTKR